MFAIYGGKTEFNQWDLNQFVTNPCMQEGDEVVFYNSHGATYVVNAFEQNGEILADVPNYLLQMEGNILVDLGQGLERHTECRTTFTVVAQAKPEGYDCQYNVPDRPSKAVGGVSSWNDLTDKPFGETKEVVEILPECHPVGDDDNGDGLDDSFYLMQNLDFVGGATYIVNWNGVEYECVAYDFSGEAGTPFFALGNGSPMDLDIGNGEPFGIFYCPALMQFPGATTLIAPLDGSTTLTISIRQEQTTITPLPAKYLPEGVPYIEEGLVEILPETTSAVSEEGSTSAMTAAAKMIVGETYIVNYNGVEYKTKLVSIEIDEGYSLTFFGNASMFDAADTGEPFMGSYVEEGGVVSFMPLDGATEVTASIKGKGETIHKLDSRCLPTDATELYLTSPGGEKFKITVSDDGVLSAAEVTE